MFKIPLEAELLERFNDFCQLQVVEKQEEMESLSRQLSRLDQEDKHLELQAESLTAKITAAKNLKRMLSPVKYRWDAMDDPTGNGDLAWDEEPPLSCQLDGELSTADAKRLGFVSQCEKDGEEKYQSIVAKVKAIKEEQAAIEYQIERIQGEVAELKEILDDSRRIR